MRKMFTALACVLALGLSATSAHALAIGDANYLGNIVPGLPSGSDNEESFIDALAGMAPSTTLSPCGDQQTSTDNTCTRSSNVFGALPDADLIAKDETGNNFFDATGVNYVLAKYGKGNEEQISHVWYVGNLSDLQFVPTLNGTLSHISTFNGGTSVPDGGATLLLLGGALVGLGALRRRFQV